MEKDYEEKETFDYPELANDPINDSEEEDNTKPMTKQEKQNNKKAKGFRAFHLNEQLYQGIKNIGYKNPTPIQRKVVPEILSGFNIIAHSRTGSGKTAAFLLPVLNKLDSHSKIVGARCIILSPSRELAHQTAMFCRKLGKFTNLRYALLVGGNELESQFEKLAQNPDIIIATPGRILHHIDEGSLQLKKIEIVVVDEGDKMMELNLGDQVKSIITQCPKNRQVVFISATIQNDLATLLHSNMMPDFKILNIEEENKIPEKLKIHLIFTRKDVKIYTFISLFEKKVINMNKELTIVFVMTKYHCEYIQEYLKYWNINSLIIYGQMEQQIRNKNLEDFRKGRTKILIVTDVAARGIDIPLLDNVVNFDFPDNQKLFIHRVGRTARAGREGRVFNLVSVDDLPYFFDIKYYLGKKFILSGDEESKKEDTIENYNSISFGSIPDKVINDIKEKKKDYLFNSKMDLEQMYSSMVKAEKKGLLFKQKPSQYGVKQTKKLMSEFDIKVHPFYIDKYTDDEKQEFLNQLKHFKPKENYFEKIRETTVDEEVLNEFKKKAEQYRKRKAIEKEKEKLLKKQESEILAEEERMEFEEKEIDTKPEEPKKETKFLGKKIKRSQIKNFKNPTQYISDTKDTTNSKSLWGGEKPLELNEVTLNINTDDTMIARKKTVWNDKKKNFVTTVVDGSGRIKNESGKIVKKNDKYHPYRDWKKTSKMSIQNAGEIEKESTVRDAKERFIERKAMKTQKSDLKNFQQVLKEKKKKFKEAQRKNKKFSKAKLRASELSQRVNLNSRSQTFIKRKINKKSFGKRKRK